MSAEAKFFFYLASFLCFLIAAAGSAWRYGRLSRQGLAPQLSLMPLGLALFVFPSVWDLGELAF